jgi:hypothetical protein
MVMTCTSRIATVTTWLTARLLDGGYDRDQAAEILDASTIASAGASIHVDFHEPPEPRALTFQFRGDEIRRIFGFDGGPAEVAPPRPAEPHSAVSV